MKRNVFFRADGHAKMGLGHVIRSLAFLGYLKDDFNCFFIIKNPTPQVKEIIKNTCEDIIEVPMTFTVEDELHLLKTMYITSDDFVVLDGYHFDTAYQTEIKKTKCALLSLDDIHHCHYVSDAVINHSLGIVPSDYSKENYTKLFLGPKYALLRPPFLEKFEEKITRQDNNLFICFGGADPHNDTLKALQKIGINHKYDCIYVVIGSAYLFSEELFNWAEEMPRLNILRNISAEEMGRVMQQSATAITAASTVCIEYLSLGGCLYVKQTVDNQKYIYKSLIEEGFAFDFESRFEQVTQSEKDEMRILQKETFDQMSNVRLREIVDFLFSSLDKK